MIQLRDYQQDIVSKTMPVLHSRQNPLIVLPTGGGKTVIIAEIVRRWRGNVCLIAHRQELVGQISTALARLDIEHRLIAPRKTIHQILHAHRIRLGRQVYNPQSNIAVAGVDTLVRRGGQLRGWLPTVNLWIIDEGHHVLRSNKWGRAVSMFPNAVGLGVTATPVRGDGAGLSRETAGFYDRMVEGPNMRWLIDNGFLVDYEIYCPPNDIDLGHVALSRTTGDYNRNQLKSAVRKSRIAGDIVDHYARLVHGKRAVTFVTDVEMAHEIANQFRAVGVPAAALSAKDPDDTRAQVLTDLEAGRIWNVINVDLFGEGFDLPAIDVVQMARPTASLALYLQQFGRGLRTSPGKDRAIIIDHAGNVLRHGLPDVDRGWTLDGAPPKARDADDDIPLRVCVQCTRPFPRYSKVCPYCGHDHSVDTGGRQVEVVAAELIKLDAAKLAEMRGEVERRLQPGDVVRDRMLAAGAPARAAYAVAKRHETRREALDRLRQVMAWFGGYAQSRGITRDEGRVMFNELFGVDTYTAQLGTAAELDELRERIEQYLTEHGVPLNEQE